MQLIRKLLSSVRPKVTRNGKTRGLSTAELVGIIVIVGILGALGGTYISSLISTARDNTGKLNAQSLTTTLATAIAAGATANAGVAANNIDTTTVTTAITDLDAGIVIGGVTYQMNPKVIIANAGSYTLLGNTFSFTPGSTP